MTDDSFTILYIVNTTPECKDRPVTYMSKLSFQYGFSVFLMTLVVIVCSASTVITANGSGSLNTSRFERPSAATTESNLQQTIRM